MKILGGLSNLIARWAEKRARTLVLIGDVVLSFGVHEQRGQQQRLVQLILQVDVVEACEDGTRGQIQLHIPQKQVDPDGT